MLTCTLNWKDDSYFVGSKMQNHVLLKKNLIFIHPTWKEMNDADWCIVPSTYISLACRFVKTRSCMLICSVMWQWTDPLTRNKSGCDCHQNPCCLATYNLEICFQLSFAAVSINRWNYQSNKCLPHANEVYSNDHVCTNNAMFVDVADLMNFFLKHVSVCW